MTGLTRGYDRFVPNQSVGTVPMMTFFKETVPDKLGEDKGP